MTRHQATLPPRVASTRPTWRGPPVPRYSAMSPYDITCPAGIASTTSRTRSAYSPIADGSLTGAADTAGTAPALDIVRALGTALALDTAQALDTAGTGRSPAAAPDTAA